MNKERRKAIEVIIEKLDEIYSSIEEIEMEEQYYFDNIPEWLKNSEKWELMEENIWNLQEAYEYISSSKETLETIINS